MDTKNWRLETIAVQAGYEPENGGPKLIPVFVSAFSRSASRIVMYNLQVQ